MKTEPHVPTWLVSAVDQRIATLRHTMPADVIKHFEVLITPLTNPEDESDAAYLQWDNSCDNCNDYAPENLITKKVTAGPIDGVPIFLMVGACKRCWEAA